VRKQEKKAAGKLRENREKAGKSGGKAARKSWLSKVYYFLRKKKEVPEDCCCVCLFVSCSGEREK